MALPTLATVQTAVKNLSDACLEDKTAVGAETAWQDLQGIVNLLKRAQTTYAGLGILPSRVFEGSGYSDELAADFTVTDATDATLAAFFAASGELGVAVDAAQDRAVVVGDVFRVNGTGDTTDNALSAAKGSGITAGDVFVITNTGTPAVSYLGVVA